MGIEHFSGRVGNFFRVTLWITGAVMLLCLPLQRIHRDAAHFRSQEMRRTEARHLALAPADKSPHANVCQPTARYSLPREEEDFTKPLHRFAIVPRVSVTRLLLRLKLGSASSSPDPFLL